MTQAFKSLKEDFNTNQAKLSRSAFILARRAELQGRIGLISKVITIVLGAFIATQSTVTQTFSKNNQDISVLYSLAGFLVVTIGGIEAAFKNETRAGELSVLAAQCHSVISSNNSKWSASVEITNDDNEKIKAIKEILEHQSTTMTDINLQAAKSGVNIAFLIEDLRLAN